MTTSRRPRRAKAARPGLAAVRALAVIMASGMPAAAAPPRPSIAAPRAAAAAAQVAGMTLDLRAGRVVVIEVANGSPADRAGVLPLDVLLAVNDLGLVDFDRITLPRVTALIPPKPGQRTRLVLGRGPGTLSVVLDQDTADDSSAVPEPPGALKIGDQAPGFVGRDLNGKELDSRTLIGKPTLIDFWASTCPPCERAAIPLRRIAEQYEGRLQVLGVSLDVDRKAFEAFVYNRHLPGRQIFDGAGWKGPIARLYHVPANGIPYSVLLDARGLIVGWGDLEDLEESIDRLASKRP